MALICCCLVLSIQVPKGKCFLSWVKHSTHVVLSLTGQTDFDASLCVIPTLDIMDINLQFQDQ